MVVSNLKEPIKSSIHYNIFHSKVGSTTLIHLIRALQHKNNFKAFNTPTRTSDFNDGSNLHVTNAEIKRQAIIDMVQNVLRYYYNYQADCLKKFKKVFFSFQKGVYIRHKNYFDFREVADIFPNITNPIYVNFVRDPVERFLSYYHYFRMPKTHVSEIAHLTRLQKKDI